MALFTFLEEHFLVIPSQTQSSSSLSRAPLGDFDSNY